MIMYSQEYSALVVCLQRKQKVHCTNQNCSRSSSLGDMRNEIFVFDVVKIAALDVRNVMSSFKKCDTDFHLSTQDSNFELGFQVIMIFLFDWLNFTDYYLYVTHWNAIGYSSIEAHSKYYV